jgi:hypothetical protein
MPSSSFEAVEWPKYAQAEEDMQGRIEKTLRQPRMQPLTLFP